MKRIAVRIVACFLFASGTGAVAVTSTSEPPTRQFENLGVPMPQKALELQFITQDKAGRDIVWGTFESVLNWIDQIKLVGVYLDTGEVIEVDFTSYNPDHGHLHLVYSADGTFIIYAGIPGRFFRYDPRANKLTEIGIPLNSFTYRLSIAQGPDHKVYVGTYPETRLLYCDPKTNTVGDAGKMTDDPEQKYIIPVAVSDENLVYCGVGLKYSDLVVYNPATGRHRSIMPSGFKNEHGAPSIWTGTDGRVYMRVANRQFRCEGEKAIEVTGASLPDKRIHGPHRLANGHDASFSMTRGGLITCTDVQTKQTHEVQSQFKGAGVHIHAVSCEHEGKIYGGGFGPADIFRYDIRTGKFEAALASFGTQIYDMLGTPKGIFFTAYTGGRIHLLDPSQPFAASGGAHVRDVAHLEDKYLQERALTLVEGPDGLVYVPTVPVKGHLGGAIARFNPADLSYEVFRNVIPNQSIVAIAPVPETGEILCASSVGGGSGSVATEKEAFVFLWDTRTTQITHKLQPLAGARGYEGRLVRARTGIVYGVMGSGHYYAVDPKERKVLFAKPIPIKFIPEPTVSDFPAGPKGLIFGLGDDALFAIDPADHSFQILARHPSIAKSHGLFVTKEHVLYYSSGYELWRCDLGKGNSPAVRRETW